MTNHFLKIFNQINPDIKDKKYLLAISGGIDSMVLLHLFFNQKLNFEVAHCNFQLRAEDSNLDQNLVEDYCQTHQIICHTKTFEISQKPQQSTQMQARELRYDWFNELLNNRHLHQIVTAHHANDQVETFLINFTRGSGLEGLTGISNSLVLRPLLQFSKHDILQFAKENNIFFREDQSNKATKYVRNKIRWQVIPTLESINPSFIQSANQNMEWLKKHHIFFKQQSAKIFDEVAILNGENWHIQIEPLKKIDSYELLLFDWLQPFGFQAWTDINSLIHAQTGKIVLSTTHQLLKNRDELIFSKLNDKITQEYIFKANEFLQFDNKEIVVEEILHFNLSKQQLSNIQHPSIYIDKNSIKFPLKIRKFKKGDYFYPFGMTGKKKLSKFFKDEKLSQLQKENTWLLCSDDQIIWVINHRMDNRFKIKPETTNILKLTYHED